jgi:hypothetical protein
MLPAIKEIRNNTSATKKTISARPPKSSGGLVHDVHRQQED